MSSDTTQTDPPAPNCDKCEQPTTLLAVIERLGRTPTQWVFECVSCRAIKWIAEEAWCLGLFHHSFRPGPADLATIGNLHKVGGWHGSIGIWINAEVNSTAARLSFLKKHRQGRRGFHRRDAVLLESIKTHSHSVALHRARTAG